MEICIDFDGTCVTHEFPEVGKEIGAAPVLKKLVAAGHNLILFTMRSNRLEKSKINDNPEIEDVYGSFLLDAVHWFTKHNIPLYGINENPRQGWTTSPKAYAQLYIDDAALGCPLIYNPEISNRPFADWVTIEELLKTTGVLPKNEITT